MLTKVFPNGIRTAADKSSFLAVCVCEGDACSCSHDGQDLIPAISSQTKVEQLPMTKPQSIIDVIRGASGADRHKFLDAITASASSLPLQDLKVLNKALAEAVKTQEAATSKKALRLGRLQAATESTDPRYEDAQRVAASGLKRLGLGALNAHCENGVNVKDLDQKMIQAGWSSSERIQLKANLHAIGLVE
jgi:hypothetical protein